MVAIRRIYDPEGPHEHYRVLIDRLWPRGISKDKASWDEWMKDIAPSDKLRKWFDHTPAKWNQFRELYREELFQKQNELNRLKEMERKFGNLILLYAARDKEYNNARVLQEILTEGSPGRDSSPEP